jgi:ferrous iron transport protein B
LVGNPNAGKTTLFNALTGLRAKTANFPGTTLEHRVGRLNFGRSVAVELIDMPGLYSLASAASEERIARDALLGRIPRVGQPSAAILIIDATNLERNLYLAGEVLELGVPTIIALNMIDLAEDRKLRIDAGKLSAELGCPVVPMSARSGRGIRELREVIEQTILGNPDKAPRPGAAFSACAAGCAGCPHQRRYDWAERIGSRCVSGGAQARSQRTEAMDAVLTHPVIGVFAFLTVMFLVFAMIFWIAQYPMDWIESFFAYAGRLVSSIVPEQWGDLRSLLTDGVIGGVGGMLVFLPQICILFFFLSLLEDTGYLARAAFVMDRLMRKVGLPGKAFVPMLSAHACAVPAIMSARVIEDRRDRLVTILVLPLMSCSARIPVYAMVVSLLFRDRPVWSALAFTGAYSLGIFAALAMAFLFKKTILKGESKPLVLELPSYKLPSLRNALLTMYDRALVFVRKAGTVILLISVTLWVLATYPKSEAPESAARLMNESHALEAAGQADAAAELAGQAEALTAQHALAHSFAGRAGRLIEPVLRPLGFDWQIGVGVVSSFAAREVIVSTLAIVYGVGDENGSPDTLSATLRRATRSDGTPVFTPATCWSLLVFYVLAMQCLPTQVITRRETNSRKWPAFQFVYMTALAYVSAMIVYQTLSALMPRLR